VAAYPAAIQDPEHEQHEELLDWLGDSFDPEAFSVGRGQPDAVNKLTLHQKLV